MARFRIGLALALAAVVLAPGTAGAQPSRCVGRTVVLVHDFAAAPASVRPLARRLEATGRCVVVPSYGVYRPGLPLGGMRAIADSAPEVAAAIATAARTSGGPVDVVAHGAGSLVAHRAVATAPRRVHAFVALGGAWRGTNLAFLGDLDLLSRALGTYPLVLAVEKLLMDGSCAVCREVIAHSDYLRALAAEGPLLPGVAMTNLVTRYDELVVPYSSGTWPGMHNVVVQDRAPAVLVEHLGLPAAPVVASLVAEALAR